MTALRQIPALINGELESFGSVGSVLCVEWRLRDVAEFSWCMRTYIRLQVRKVGVRVVVYGALFVLH